MRIPDPYFKNVPIYGDLRLDEIIVEYVYPLLSTLKDSNGNRYLCLCFDIRESQKWLIVPISIENLINVLTDRITLDKPFKESKNDIIFATWDYNKKKDSYQVIENHALSKDMLPIEGEFLEEEPEELETYLSVLRHEKMQLEEGWANLSKATQKIEVIKRQFSHKITTINCDSFYEDSILQSSSTMYGCLPYSFNNRSLNYV